MVILGENMKRKIILLLSLVTAAVLLFTQLFTVEKISRERLLSYIIVRELEYRHYSKQKIDDEFSGKAFTEFLKFQDINKRFLIQEDIKRLRKYKDKIDDEIARGSTGLITLTRELLHKRITQVMGFYEEIMARPFDFTKEESLELDVDKRAFCSNLDELKDLWRKTLKYNTMIRYINLLKTEKKVQGEKELEETARKEVSKSFKRNFDRLLQGNENDALSRYFNAVVNVYDPHTIYFPPKEKQDFDIEMSGTFEGIGALLGEKDGYVSVAQIIPGGPSWRQKELQPGDLILKVAQADEEPVDIVGMRVEDAVKLIRGKKGTLVRLTVKKPDGQIKVISIVRDVVVIEEAFARSAVLVQEQLGKTIGYIYLPKFYNDFSQEGNGRNSTDDVKMELEKLKKKKVQGIILDLRSNSGGALMDAIRMSGLFIPTGPIVQVKDKKHGAQSFDDPDPGISYSGPLVVLINSLSASATEILAAALQDYNRALIVGGAHSFGKGTVQIMLNLDSHFIRKPDYINSLGALAVTIQKFYRVNGTSIQLKGVTPDIILPDRFDYLELGEKYYDNPLEWDSVAPLTYKKWTDNPVDIKALAEKSRERVQKTEGFQQLKAYIQKLNEMHDDTLQSLHLQTVMKQQEEIRKETEKFNKSQEEDLPIKVFPCLDEEKELSPRLAKAAEERQQEWIGQIKKDLTLNETIAILNDLINVQQPMKDQ